MLDGAHVENHARTESLINEGDSVDEEVLLHDESLINEDDEVHEEVLLPLLPPEAPDALADELRTSGLSRFLKLQWERNEQTGYVYNPNPNQYTPARYKPIHSRNPPQFLPP